MSVYNDARYLRGAVDSVLAQDDVKFEFIIINDGSTDVSTSILRDYAAADPRIRLIEQNNTGLTRALIRGCSEARAPYIARQDSDDYSVKGRFKILKSLLDDNPELVMVSSWAEVIGPEDETLLVYERPAEPNKATYLMIHGRTGPPGHGSVMFRRDAYEKVGGYNEMFRYAQDSDLWLRMAEIGKIGYSQDVLYRYRISEQSISGMRHFEKLAYAKLIDRMHEARLANKSFSEDFSSLSRAHYNKPSSAGVTLYFIGRQLAARKDPRAFRYLLRSIKADPFRWKVWLFLFTSLPRFVASRGTHSAPGN